MKIITLATVTLFFGLQALGAADSPKKPSLSKYQSFMKSQGGMLIKPDSMKGKALIYNAQKSATSSNIAVVARRLSRDMRMNFVAEDGSLDGVNGDWKSLRESKGASAIVIVTETGSTPSLLVAPDERWAVINVSKLGEGLTTDEAKAKFIPGRVTRQIYRAFALLGGSGKPRNESPSTVRNLNELDLSREALPMDTLQQLAYQLEGHGMSREVHATYKQACMQGWAPQPTNEYQKAIWDKVHEIPTKPIKIEFDPKTDTK